MTVSINWGTKVISVPKADLTLVSGTVYQYDLETLRLAIIDLEDSPAGMVNPDVMIHNTAVTLAGVTYARTIQFINGYTITFEDGMYAVNLFGANSNIADVVNVNQVSLRTSNSAGLTSPGSGASPTELWDLADAIETGFTPRQTMRLLLAALAGKVSGANGVNPATVVFRSAIDAKDRITADVDGQGNRTNVTVDGT